MLQWHSVVVKCRPRGVKFSSIILHYIPECDKARVEAGSGKDDFQISPGLFELPLFINRGSYANLQVEYKKTTLEKYLQLKLHRPERHAIRNLLGLLETRIENYQEAWSYFTKVITEDPANLNAIANRQSLAKILHRFSESDECNEQLRLLQRSTASSEMMKTKRNARCLAEQAYAYAFDIVDDSIGCERYIRSHQLYFKAMELAGNHVDVEERHDWELGDAIVCRKIYNSKCKTAEPVGNYVSYLETSL